jgi:hypothetical protein
MKEFFACSDPFAFTGFEITALTRGCGLTAMGAACAIHIVLPTNIRHKYFKGVIAKRIKTSSQIRISKVQLVCNEEDVQV